MSRQTQDIVELKQTMCDMLDNLYLAFDVKDKSPTIRSAFEFFGGLKKELQNVTLQMWRSSELFGGHLYAGWDELRFSKGRTFIEVKTRYGEVSKRIGNIALIKQDFDKINWNRLVDIEITFSREDTSWTFTARSDGDYVKKGEVFPLLMSLDPRSYLAKVMVLIGKHDLKKGRAYDGAEYACIEDKEYFGYELDYQKFVYIPFVLHEENVIYFPLNFGVKPDFKKARRVVLSEGEVRHMVEQLQSTPIEERWAGFEDAVMALPIPNPRRRN